MRLPVTRTLIALSIFCSACGRAQKNPPKTIQIEDHKEIMRFVSEGDTLEGMLEVPLIAMMKDNRIPLIVFVHGSGRATRNDYEDVCGKLHQAGFATFRYDKRGVGRSGGAFQELGPYNSEARVKLLAADAATAVQQLKQYSWFEAQKIIVMGGSQAGWIIPVVCKLADVSAAVIFSGPTVSVGEEIYYSDLAEHGSRTQVDADKMLASFRGVHGFDNISYVAEMKRPSIWIFGGKDISIPVKECIHRLDSVKKLNTLPAEIKLYPDADHGLFNREKGMREDFVSYVIEWLDRL